MTPTTPPKPGPTPKPVTVALPTMGPPAGMPLMAWLAIGTSTALAMFIGSWSIERAKKPDPPTGGGRGRLAP